MDNTIRKEAEKSASSLSENEFFDSRMEKIIRTRAALTLQCGLFQPYEINDIEQDLRIILWRQMENYNPELSGKYTFASRVAANHARNIIKHRLRELKKQGNLPNANDWQNDNAHSAEISSDQSEMAFGGQCRTALERQELREEIDWLLANLPPADRLLCEAVLADDSFKAAAKRLGIPFATLHLRFRTGIRRKALLCGFQGFPGGGR